MQLNLNDAFVLDGLKREQIVLVYHQHPRLSDRRVVKFSFLLIILSDLFAVYNEGNVPFQVLPRYFEKI